MTWGNKVFNLSELCNPKVTQSVGACCRCSGLVGRETPAHLTGEEAEFAVAELAVAGPASASPWPPPSQGTLSWGQADGTVSGCAAALGNVADPVA